MKPVSLVLLSVQLSRTCVADITAAERPVGAAGTAPAAVVRFTTFDHGEAPAALNAWTR